MQDKKPEIVLLLGSTRSSIFLYNYLKQYFNISAAIIEQPVSSSIKLKRKAKKLGWFKVAGQMAFQASVPKLLKISSKKRLRQLIKKYNLSDAPIDNDKIINVSSVNSQEAIDQLNHLQPSVVVINGTRIISQKVLESVPCRFINTHAGITPKYRGVHGGYWALASNDIDKCGVTIHFVDKGIDTGDIISQHLINPDTSDNFLTYPIHQLGTALPKLVEAIHGVLHNSVVTQKAAGTSKLWYHPTIWEYLYNRVFRGVK